MRTAVVAVLLLALAASTAQGAEVVPTAVEGAVITGGPALAGEGVAWGEVGHRRESLQLRDGATTRRIHDFATYDPSSWMELDASPEWLAVLRLRSDRYTPVGSVDFHHGPLDGAMDELAPCGGPPSVSGRAVALRCGPITVREDGAQRQFAVPEDTPFAIAGPWLAYRTREEVVVLDRTTGTEHYRVAAPVDRWVQQNLDPGNDPAAIAVREDGLVVFDLKGHQVAWASAAEPSPHPLSLNGSELRLAGDRVAAADRRNIRQVTVRVRTLADEPLDRLEGLPWRGWDFDGRRVAWRVRPCAMSSVVVIEVGERRPDVGSDCGTPEILRRTLRLGRDGHITVTLSCPRWDLAGCGGELELCRPGTRVVCAYEKYASPPGVSRRVRVRIAPWLRPQLRRAKPPRRLRVTLRAIDVDYNRRLLTRRSLPLRIARR
jgi:hypothetical protein